MNGKHELNASSSLQVALLKLRCGACWWYTDYLVPVLVWFWIYLKIFVFHSQFSQDMILMKFRSSSDLFLVLVMLEPRFSFCVSSSLVLAKFSFCPRCSSDVVLV